MNGAPIGPPRILLAAETREESHLWNQVIKGEWPDANIIIADTTEQAHELLQEHMHTLRGGLIGYRVPDEGGIPLIRKWRERELQYPGRKGAKIFLLTGDHDETFRTDADEARTAGADASITEFSEDLEGQIVVCARMMLGQALDSTGEVVH